MHTNPIYCEISGELQFCSRLCTSNTPEDCTHVTISLSEP